MKREVMPPLPGYYRISPSVAALFVVASIFGMLMFGAWLVTDADREDRSRAAIAGVSAGSALRVDGNATLGDSRGSCTHYDLVMTLPNVSDGHVRRAFLDAGWVISVDGATLTWTSAPRPCDEQEWVDPCDNPSLTLNCPSRWGQLTVDNSINLAATYTLDCRARVVDGKGKLIGTYAVPCNGLGVTDVLTISTFEPAEPAPP